MSSQPMQWTEPAEIKEQEFDVLGAKQLTRETKARALALAARIGRGLKAAALTLIDTSALDVANLVITNWRRIWPTTLLLGAGALVAVSPLAFCIASCIGTFALLTWMAVDSILDD